MALPETLNILGLDHRVVREESEHFTSEYYGQLDSTKQTIRIGSHISGDLERETLLHEVLHGVDFAMRTELAEGDVLRLARGLYAVLRANPALVAYLTK